MGKLVLTFAAAACCIAVTASAPAAPLSVRDSFRIGNSGTSFCSAQSVATDKALTDMFDAGYSITCRDAACRSARCTSCAISRAPPRVSPRPVATRSLAPPPRPPMSRISARSR